MTSSYDGGKRLGVELGFCRYTEMQLLRAFLYFLRILLIFQALC